MSKTRSAMRYIVAIAGLVSLVGGVWGQGSGDALERSFKDPPGAGVRGLDLQAVRQ